MACDLSWKTRIRLPSAPWMGLGAGLSETDSHQGGRIGQRDVLLELLDPRLEQRNLQQLLVDDGLELPHPVARILGGTLVCLRCAGTRCDADAP